MKLLIVDDSNIIRKKIERSCNIPNLNVVGSASNGVDAIEMFKQHQPELVTMDITMPAMDGIECIEEINKINSDALILVVSALNDKATAIQALKRGAHGFLCKPFNDDSLNEALQELITSNM